MRSARLGIGVALMMVLTGCGAHAPTLASPGIDGLTIPMTPLEPAGFVATVDNPWLDLQVGARTWIDPDGTVTVSTRPVEHRGIAAMRVGRQVLAQDRAGNVWSLVGDTGYLLLTAQPRRGDSYRSGPDQVSEVVETGADLASGGGEYDDVTKVEVDGPSGIVTNWYAYGIGLVLITRSDGSTIMPADPR